MSHTAVTLQVFMSGQDDIIVKADWEPHPGEPMPQMPGCFIGKKFGAGALAFNRIFDIVDQDGKGTGVALKVCRPTLAARRSLAHEWKMFKDLSLLANDFAAARSHFLQAERVVRLGDGKIAGIVMEKANGQNVDKTLKDPKFCNVRYVIALLRDLLVGLDVAQRVLGFTHYDLKLDNVMEHWNCDPDAGKARLMIDAVPQFKIFDFGTAVVYPDPFAVRRVVDDHLEGHHPDAAPQLAEQHPHNRRGNITRSNRGPFDYEYSTPFLCVRIYHLWWKQRGDVFRVLSALCKHLDDRTWPLEDLELVSLLFTVLEHTTNSRRLRARFEPRQRLLQRLYGPHPPPPYAPQGSTTTSPGLSKQQSEALIRQHSQVVLQGSMGMLASQGSSQLPSPAAIEAFSKQQRQQQRQHKQLGGGAALQGVAEGDGEAEEELPRAAAPPVLRINTTKIPAATAAAPAGATAAAAGGSAYPAAGSAGVGGRPSTHPSTPPAGGQYTPRRSTEVPREELSSFPVSGMAYVRLAKAPPAAGAAGAGAGGGPAATSTSSPSPAPPSPFAVSGAQGATGFSPAWGQQGLAETGSSGEGGTSAGSGYRGLGGGGSSSGSSYNGTPVAAGVQQMVSGASPEQRRRQQERISAPLLQQQQQQYDSRVVNSNSSSSARPQQQRRHEAVAAATAAAGAAAPQHEEYVLETAPTGVPDPFAYAPAGVSSGAPPHLRTGEDNSSAGAAHRQDSEATIVAKQPVAAAPKQSVLGSRKALRGVTAQQLLVEPVIQSLLSKV